ncbi:LysM peptidoglycan-binding domain-containing protein [Desulforhopalus sp. IMCC35007]|uniref:LysM peptidoglycan-binding domain-containing protein n=1 Tax=Desulforhopalus sp. IMCC35007 TaxID=2569543 RepID=UPI0010ADD27D|nr:LysM peptidoglycan-binding domain-containing protein [Desulforhopalus sp. IMCC35007]TKB06734.1 LysM peptidoglycan-binding domain-containing protein [Desulforhopalus sp. IMCC35007]
MSFKKTKNFLYICLSIICLAPVCQLNTAAAQDFPRYKAIESNVQFWEKVYATYSLNQVVIHDSNDLTKVYEIVDLLDPSLPNAAQINANAEKQAIQKYTNLLKKLSQQRPVSEEEKRVAAQFSGKYRSRDMGNAADSVRSQRGQKERFQEGVVYSGGYISEIKRIFRSYHLPEDLAYLPHVESSFNTRAYSKFGAAGIWQFTRSTGKRYLLIDDSVDERLDPIRASHAAAQYLQKSYQHLKNWPLALTSYNYGLPGMIRAQKEHDNYVDIFSNYSKGYFKFASRNFYSEFLAALKVAKDLEARIKMHGPQQVSYLKLKGYMSLDTLSRHLKLSPDVIIHHNPALRPAVINGEKHIPDGYLVRLPYSSTTKQLTANIPSSLYKNNQKATKYHRVQNGETASAIAKRYGISLKQLRAANNLDEFATIFIKQNLRIPAKAIIRNSKSKKDYTGNTRLNEPPTLVPKKKSKPDLSATTPLPTKDPTVYSVFQVHKKNGKTLGYIKVQPEESLSLYAKLLGISQQELYSLNNLKTNSALSPGQELLLQFDNLAPARFEEKRLDFLQETEDDFFSAYSVVGQKSYKVSAGDTLWDLCYNKFEIPLWLLERYNSTINLAQLNRDQELIIPIVQQI